jgi:hypothetical protein
MSCPSMRPACRCVLSMCHICLSSHLSSMIRCPACFSTVSPSLHMGIILYGTTNLQGRKPVCGNSYMNALQLTSLVTTSHMPSVAITITSRSPTPSVERNIFTCGEKKENKINLMSYRCFFLTLLTRLNIR